MAIFLRPPPENTTRPRRHVKMHFWHKLKYNRRANAAIQIGTSSPLVQAAQKQNEKLWHLLVGKSSRSSIP